MTISGMQLSLFQDVGYPPRPRIYDKKVLENALDALVPRVIKWLHADNDLSNSEDVRQHLHDAIEFEDDSRKIVNYLEDHCYWRVNRDLQDIMDNVVEDRHLAFIDLTNRWVLQNGVSPKYSIGQSVKFKNKGKNYQGEIVSIDTSTAKYLVFCEQLGHVKKGIGTHGTYVPYEEVQIVKFI